MNAIVTVGAVELALLRAEAAKLELNSLFERAHGRDLTEAEDQRLDDAQDSYDRTQADLRRLATQCLGVDLERVLVAIS